MGADIHWIIERRHRNGTWHAVATKSHSLHRLFRETGFNFGAWEQRPEDAKLGARNYDLFSLLSDVRSENTVENPIMNSELPDDLSEMARLEIDGYGVDGHSHGWAGGGMVLGFTRSRDENLKRFGKTFREVLLSGVADLILPRNFYDEASRDWIYPDIDETEPAHDRLLRIRDSENLLPWEDDHDNLRLIVFYDN